MSDLPLWFRIGALLVLLALLVFNLVWDATHAEYEGAGATLMLGGVIGAAIGLDQLRKGGSE